jgi:hypothetical protein
MNNVIAVILFLACFAVIMAELISRRKPALKDKSGRKITPEEAGFTDKLEEPEREFMNYEHFQRTKAHWYKTGEWEPSRFV